MSLSHWLDLAMATLPIHFKWSDGEILHTGKVSASALAQRPQVSKAARH